MPYTSTHVHTHTHTYTHTFAQLLDAKKKSDDDQTEIEEMQSARRKQDKEMEALQERIEELTAEIQKTLRSKKKLQDEVGLGG